MFYQNAMSKNDDLKKQNKTTLSPTAPANPEVEIRKDRGNNQNHHSIALIPLLGELVAFTKLIGTFITRNISVYIVEF